MESKKELYHHGLNPNFVESFDNEMCAQMLFALESLRIPYTRIPFHDHDVRSLRFYLADEQSVMDVKKFLSVAHPASGANDPYEKYKLVYENSFV